MFERTEQAASYQQGVLGTWPPAAPRHAAGTVRTCAMPPFAFWNKRERGRQGEDDALAYLLLQGLVLLERNYLCKGGELDLIMRDGAMQSSSSKCGYAAVQPIGGALASITPAKQRRMVVAAQTWLQGQKTLPPCRFDALAIDGGRISWLQNILDM